MQYEPVVKIVFDHRHTLLPRDRYVFSNNLNIRRVAVHFLLGAAASISHGIKHEYVYMFPPHC